MGDLLRQFWTPFLPSRDLPEKDGNIKRVKLLGEDLVAFRDTNGDVGLIAENCPHRGASLFFGRNENYGLACNYHGWKYDVTGACVDMPNEPTESNFKDKVRVTAYPCHEVNRMIWAYMGSRETPPPFPAFEVNTLPIDQVFEPSIMVEECNWIQGLEGDLDSSHVPFIHGRIAKDSPDPPGWGRGSWVDDRAPVLDVVPTLYGAVYSAKRVWNDQGERWHRITQYVMPFYTMIAAGSPNGCSARAWVPIDDEYHMLINMHGRLEGTISAEEQERAWQPYANSGGYVPETPDPRTRYHTAANKTNDYAINYDIQKTANMSGIPRGGNLQDRAMTETMGVIYDRTREHLGTSDRMIIAVRQRLMSAARDFQEDGTPPAHVDDTKLYRIRSASAILPEGANWQEETRENRDADAGAPVSFVPLT
jgi:phenylpropionate dioxygenase-like ring-hydroxylating dioxygenase large terminal subunit